MPPKHKKAQSTSRPNVKQSSPEVISIKRMSWVAIGLLAVLALAVVLAAKSHVASVADTIIDGVSIGGVNVSGMTRNEAIEEVAKAYNARISAEPVYIYASNEDMEAEAQNPEVTEADSLEDVRRNTVAWTTTASETDAQIDYASLVDQALNVGRDNMAAQLGIDTISEDIPVTVHINTHMVEELAQTIDYTLGDPYQDYGIRIEEDKALVTEGHDGYMVDREWLASEIGASLLHEPGEPRAFVADVDYHKVQIDADAAQKSADLVNAAIAKGLNFTCGESRWSLTPAQLAHWVRTEVIADGEGNYKLQPYINGAQAKSALLVSANGGFAEGSAKVTFEKKGDAVHVAITGAEELPMVGDAVNEMDKILFGGKDEAPLIAPPTFEATPSITIKTAQVPTQMTLEDAVHYGIVTIVSEYTTEYTEGVEARNHNIHLAADLIDGSITRGGEVWSFNEVVGGECDESKGFKAAATIANNETVDAIGGGICQVATTVFNAAYQAGYDIVERNNHSLYIASYPAGRDATIAWPELDLKFRNETASDIYLDMSYTDSSVTATIYGIDPGYTVETETGEMQPGAKSVTRYEYDPSLGAGGEITKSYGVDGQQITIVRHVYNAQGDLVREDVFHSEYNAVDTVISRGDQTSSSSDETSNESASPEEASDQDAQSDTAFDETEESTYIEDDVTYEDAGDGATITEEE